MPGNECRVKVSPLPDGAEDWMQVGLNPGSSINCWMSLNPWLTSLCHFLNFAMGDNSTFLTGLLLRAVHIVDTQ